VDVKDFYDRHPDRFRETEEAKLEGIYVRDLSHDGDPEKAKAYATSLVDRARGNEPFEKLVAEVHGDRPLGLYDEPFDRRTGEEKFPPEVQEFAWTKPVGTVSDPIRMPSGWLILKLERRRPARLVPFEEVRDQIEQGLFNLKMNIGRLKLQLDLLEDAVVEPRRFKNAIREGLKEEIRRNLDELNG
jgi:peptidyl-prolyl cis-trans isomerase C